MNRLILIGNGFDLAHGLDTRYNDFILWYLKKCFKQAFKDWNYNDEILHVERTQFAAELFLAPEDRIADYIDELYKTNGFHSLIYSESYPNKPSPFYIQFKSDFLSLLLSKCNFSTWVSIENEYYSELKSILYDEPRKRSPKLQALNNSFAYITKQLEEYLNTIQCFSIHPDFGDILESPIYNKDILNPKWEGDVQPNDSLILNFNYTNTVENYFKSSRDTLPIERIKVNYIHGRLQDKNNPIIFGFGDELDADYARMELEKNNGYFEHIKSFGYFKTSNYYNLIRFLDSDEYQIFILGHSCGLSDRTMLNMIFEHENCKSIKIYYYENKEGQNNFTELTQEISRHFKDKAMMRRKIVSIDKSSPMPQVE